jgi:hypothetical protein
LTTHRPHPLSGLFCLSHISLSLGSWLSISLSFHSLSHQSISRIAFYSSLSFCLTEFALNDDFVSPAPPVLGSSRVESLLDNRPALSSPATTSCYFLGGQSLPIRLPHSTRVTAHDAEVQICYRAVLDVSRCCVLCCVDTTGCGCTAQATAFQSSRSSTVPRLRFTIYSRLPALGFATIFGCCHSLEPAVILFP